MESIDRFENVSILGDMPPIGTAMRFTRERFKIFGVRRLTKNLDEMPGYRFVLYRGRDNLMFARVVPLEGIEISGSNG
jgi:hypothetical protein